MGDLNTQICAIWMLLILGAALPSSASNGDRTQFFHNCRQNCERTNCSAGKHCWYTFSADSSLMCYCIADGLEIQEQAIDFYGQTIFDRIFGWSCADECSYGCMWRTVFAFLERGWPIPQFYGKWPFLRLFGMQEPASVIFSLLNFAAHVRLLRKFRREVRPDSPCYKLAHIFSLV